MTATYLINYVILSRTHCPSGILFRKLGVFFFAFEFSPNALQGSFNPIKRRIFQIWIDPHLLTVLINEKLIYNSLENKGISVNPHYNYIFPETDTYHASD